MTSPALARELKRSGDTKLLGELERKKSKNLPEPTLDSILETYEYLREFYRPFRDMAKDERQRRYFKDKLPKRMQSEQLDGRRFYTRLTHNEINRVVGQQTDNPPRFIIPSAGPHSTDKEKGQKQTRWANNLLPALERGAKNRRGSNLRRRAVDLQNEIGFVAYEVYLTKSYDDLDANAFDPEMSAADKLAKLESQARERKLPFGVRVIDGLNLYLDEDDDMGSVALICEEKPWPMVKRRYGAKAGKTALEPLPGATGFSMELDVDRPSGLNTVPTIRYYDDEWYAYVVNGRLVDGPHRHGMPGMPVVPFYGLTTGSSNMEEGVQGICWGMGPAEVALNDIITIMIDTMWKNRQPKWVVETAIDGRVIPDATNPANNATLDLSDLEAVQQLNPGQTLKNAYENWEPWFQLPLVNLLFETWGKSAQNPIAQGTSPGADPAGYTVATLTDNAMTVYKDSIANEARAWGQLCDFIRLMIRDTIKVPVPLTVPMADKRLGGVEWLALGPDDITEVPTIVTIDPNSDAHRLANRQSWMEGNAAGFVPRREVQVRAFGAEDPEAWDDEIVLDGMRERVAQLGVEGALMDAQMIQQPPPVDPAAGGPPPPSGLVGPDGVTPISSSPPVPTGPPPVPPPSVGAPAAQASAAFTGAARAGEDNGYVPRSARQ